MIDPAEGFKFKVPTPVTTLAGKAVIISADAYRSSKETILLKLGGDPALLRYYLVANADSTTSEYLNEPDLIALIGGEAFSTLGE
jgi:hypothetical protein